MKILIICSKKFYTEIEGFAPTIINGDLSKIK